jgi:hypothetical protein
VAERSEALGQGLGKPELGPQGKRVQEVTLT